MGRGEEGRRERVGAGGCREQEEKEGENNKLYNATRFSCPDCSRIP